MSGGEFLENAGQQLARQAMERREAAIKDAIYAAVVAAWMDLGARSGVVGDNQAARIITDAVVRKIAAVSAAIAEADRTPPVLEVIEGEGPNVRIRTVDGWSPITSDHWLNEPGPGARP